jgi:hypothetical protein
VLYRLNNTADGRLMKSVVDDDDDDEGNERGSMMGIKRLYH